RDLAGDEIGRAAREHGREARPVVLAAVREFERRRRTARAERDERKEPPGRIAEVVRRPGADGEHAHLRVVLVREPVERGEQTERHAREEKGLRCRLEGERGLAVVRRCRVEVAAEADEAGGAAEQIGAAVDEVGLGEGAGGEGEEEGEEEDGTHGGGGEVLRARYGAGTGRPVRSKLGRPDAGPPSPAL